VKDLNGSFCPICFFDKSYELSVEVQIVSRLFVVEEDWFSLSQEDKDRTRGQ